MPQTAERRVSRRAESWASRAEHYPNPKDNYYGNVRDIWALHLFPIGPCISA